MRTPILIAVLIAGPALAQPAQHPTVPPTATTAGQRAVQPPRCEPPNCRPASEPPRAESKPPATPPTGDR